MKARLVATAGALWLLSMGAQAAERQYVGPRRPADVGQPPFSRAVRIGDTVYLSGEIGRTPEGKVPEDPEAEARVVLDNVKRTLGEAGLTMDDLVSVQVFCTDLTLYDAWNRVYRTYFTRELPARAFIGSGKLVFGARFEVQGIAVKR
ncbi:MAG TPA: RidA family protein [Vicinamibacteria bacterium]|nr:RidA family protein [Vicinamibacteria bacterium]